MTGATRYLLRQVAGPLLFVTLTLTGIVWLSQSLRFIDRIVNYGMPFGSFLWLTSLLLPSLLAVVLPIALFCAVLFAYHRLAGDSELVVFWAAGIGKWALARPALIAAAAVAALVYGLLLYFAPMGQRTLRTTQFEFRTSLASVLIQEGVFNTPVEGLTVYVRERHSSGEMFGILVHDNRNAQKPITMMAERGVLVATPFGPRFVLHNGNRQAVEPDRRQLSLLYFDSYTIDLAGYARGGQEGWREPNERFLHELFWPNLESPDDRRHYDRLIVEGHRRLTAPLYAPVLALVALAAMLGGEFNRRGRTARVAIAAAAAIAIQVTGIGFGHLASKSLVLIPALYLLPLLFAAGAAWLMVRRPARLPAQALPVPAA